MRPIKVTREEVSNSNLFAYLTQEKSSNKVIISHTLSKQYANTELKICDLEAYGSNSKKTSSFLMQLPYFNQLILSFKLLKTLFTKKGMTDNLKNESFKGIFATATFNKNLSGHTLVLPDYLEQKIGQFAQTLQGFNLKNEELVKLENPIFEKAFKVYSTDQVEARYALTPAMMEQLIALKNKIDKPIMVSFKDKKVNIAIINTRGLVSLDKSIPLTNTLLQSTYQELTAISVIVEELNLNTNIWGPIN